MKKEVILRTPMRTRSNSFSDVPFRMNFFGRTFLDALLRTHFFGRTFLTMDRGAICWSV
jgi:hypothetical protein